MFEKILSWIKGVLAKMLGQSSIKTALNVDIAVSSAMIDALTLWTKLYENDADWLTNDIKSLNLASAIASEIARSVTIEMSVDVSGSTRANYLDEQLTRLVPKLRKAVEYGAAKGGVVFKPYVSGGRIVVDIVHADQFFPVKFDEDGDIQSAIFADQRTVGDKYYTRLEYHQTSSNGVEIRNMAYRSTTKDMLGVEVPLATVAEWADIEPQATITGVDRPLFAYFRIPMANNIDPASPLGVSAYSRATDLIEQADKHWSNFLWEFESGQRALFVDVLAFGKNSDGTPVLPNKRLYRTVDTAGAKDDFFQEWTPTFRQADLLAGLDAILKRIEYTTGLAYGTLSDPNLTEKTATEIAAGKQRTAATVTDTQKALQDALDQLIWAIDVWCTLAKLAPGGSYSVVYEFDDSIIVDKDMQFQQDMRLVTHGLMSKVEFRMRNFGEDELTAKAKIAAVNAETQPVDMFAGV